jgi:hypothetical protein
LYLKGQITARSLAGSVPTSGFDTVFQKDPGARLWAEHQELHEYQSTLSLECATDENDVVVDQQREVKKNVSGRKPFQKY